MRPSSAYLSSYSPSCVSSQQEGWSLPDSFRTQGVPSTAVLSFVSRSRWSIGALLLLLLSLASLSPLLLSLVCVHGDAVADSTWLVALYNATNGAGWSSSCASGWNIANPSSACSWSGVQCSGGLVSSVSLEGCNLNGGPLPDIPAPLAAQVGTALQNCASIELASNHITGSLPSSWSSMSSLNSLDVAYNHITGSLPASWSSMSSLMTLELEYNTLTGTLPSSWYSLRSFLDLSSNYVFGDVPSSWLESNAMIQGSFGGNCFRVSNASLVTATGRLFSMGSRRHASECETHSETPSASNDHATASQSMTTNITRSEGSPSLSATNISATNSIARSGTIMDSSSNSTVYTVGMSMSVSRSTTRSDSNVLITCTPVEKDNTSSMSNSVSAVSTVVTQSVVLQQSSSVSPTDQRRGGESGSLTAKSVSSISLTKTLSMPPRQTASMGLLSSATLTTPLGTTLTIHHQLRLNSVSQQRSLTTSRSRSGSASMTTTGEFMRVNSSSSVSTSLSTCEETPVCWIRQPNATASGLCQETNDCIALAPSVVGYSSASSPGVANAQVSRETLVRGASKPLIALIECSPAGFRLLNRSTSGSEVLVQTSPAAVRLSLPRDAPPEGWVSSRQQSVFKAFSMEFLLPAACGDRVVNITLAVVVIPLSLPQLAIGGAVQATDRTVMWLGSIAGGGASGGSASRVAAVRSLLLCSRAGASSGGLLGLSLTRSVDRLGDGLLANARGAIVGNTIVLIAWLIALLALAGVYHRRTLMRQAPASHACARVALPSSLLPICAVLLPSTSGGVLILAAGTESPLDAVDMVTLAVGCLTLAVTLVPLLWLCTPSFARVTLRATLDAASSSSTKEEDCISATHDEGSMPCSTFKEKASLLWRRVVKPRYMWSPLLSSEAKEELTENNGRSDTHSKNEHPTLSLAARGCSVILMEHRRLWYATLDMWLLCATGMLGAASGVFDAPSVCRGAAMMITALLFLEFAVVVVVRPLTSVLGNVHTSFVLLLTGLGTVVQVVSIEAGNDFSSSVQWALPAAAVCGFLVVGVSATKVILVDAPHHLGAARAYFNEIRAGSISGDDATEVDEVPIINSEDCVDPPTPTKTQPECVVDLSDEMDAFNGDFWDELTGEVHTRWDSDMVQDKLRGHHDGAQSEDVDLLRQVCL